MLKSRTAYIFLIASFVVSLLGVSCGKETAPYPYSIRQAERLMHRQPDIARKLLTAFRDSLAGLTPQKSNYPEALTHFKGYLQTRDSIRKIRLTESVCKAQALYNYQKVNVENRQLKLANAQKKWLMLESLLASLFLFAGIGFFIRRIQTRKQIAWERERMHRKEKEAQYRQSLACMEENEKEIKTLTAQLKQAEQEKDAVLEESLRIKNELLEMTNPHNVARRKALETEQKTLFGSDIYLKFHSAYHDDTIQIDEEDWQTLQKELDRKYENFTHRLYELYPRLSRMELRICCLLKISISVTQMAFLLERSKSSISAARFRLYKKLFARDGKPDDLDSFISAL